MSLAYINGELVDKADISISIDDFGFARGNSIFEMARVYGDKPFHLDEHLTRLLRGIDICYISQPFSKKQIEVMILDLVEKNKMPQSVIQMYVTQGVPKTSKRSLSVGDDYESKVIIVQKEVQVLPTVYEEQEDFYIEGITVATTYKNRTLPEAKTTNYINAIKAMSELEGEGFDDVLYVNENEEILEASRSNIFFTKGNQLITPSEGMLLGVTRGVIIDISKRLGLDVQVRLVLKNEIASMDGAFLASSLSELVPIKLIDGKEFDVSMYDVYKKIWQAFKLEIS